MSSRISIVAYERRITLVLVFVSMLLAGVVGGLVVFQPLAAFAIVPLLAVLLLLYRADRVDEYFLATLGGVLVGYAFFGRGFAYLGAHPLFVGEIVVGLALLALLVNVRRWRIGLVETLLLSFMLLGAVATIPYLTTYGTDALRDAVIWGYAVVALTVAWLVRREHFEIISRWYGLLLVPLVLWLPGVLAASAILGLDLPSYPWSGRPMVDVKPGDTAVHLAGVAVFILTGLWMKRSALSAIAEGMVWSVWFIGFVLAASWNRGGLVAATAAVTTLLVLRPDRRMLVPILSISLMVTVLVLVDPTVEVRAGREVSVDQVTANLKSVVGDSENTRLEGTREWRLDWWGKIVDYTVNGEYFWTGKGFGINLRTDDLPHPTGESNLRSPHSSHMTVLARMGVPGAVLWIALQGAFAVAMITAIYRSYGGRDQTLTAMLIMIFAYWLAMVINSSFDVYFEGPQGGIWFWAVYGLGIAAIRFQAEQTSSSNPVKPDASGKAQSGTADSSSPVITPRGQ